MDNRKLVVLLAVPAVAMMCRASARRAAWLEGVGPEGHDHGHGHPAFGPGRFGRGAGFGGRGWSRDPGAWSLPPFIEAKLDEWHRAAHAEEVPEDAAPDRA